MSFKTMTDDRIDQVFANIASGVITTDAQDIVTSLNRAAEHILTVSIL